MKANKLKQLYYWIKRDGRYFHKDIYKGITNLIKWFPIVWNDRDWDQAYIFYVLRFKLNNTANYLEKQNGYVGVERDVEKIRLCVRLIDKIKDEDYCFEYQDYYKTVFEFEKVELGLTEMKGNVLSDNLEDYFKKHISTYRKVKKQYPDYEDISLALHIGSEMENKAMRLLFTIMERNINGWWD